MREMSGASRAIPSASADPSAVNRNTIFVAIEFSRACSINRAIWRGITLHWQFEPVKGAGFAQIRVAIQPVCLNRKI
jgi:hypothetical protein